MAAKRIVSESAKQKCREWNARNPEKVKKYQAAYYHRNKEKRMAAYSAWCAANPEKRRATQRPAEKTYRDNNPDKRRATNRKSLYGITDDRYQEMVTDQGGRCLICKEPPSKKSLAVDHCHKTGKVRGLLCHMCNLALGGFKDNPELLKSAIAYLGEYADPETV
jgi:hypothetical protein